MIRLMWIFKSILKISRHGFCQILQRPLTLVVFKNIKDCLMWIFKEISRTSGPGFLTLDFFKKMSLNMNIKSVINQNIFQEFSRLPDIGFYEHFNGHNCMTLDVYYKEQGPLDMNLHMDFKDLLTGIFKQISTTSRREFCRGFQEI